MEKNHAPPYRVRKEFIDDKKEKLKEIVEKINAVYQGSFAKIENIKVEIYNDQQIENTARFHFDNNVHNTLLEML